MKKNTNRKQYGKRTVKVCSFFLAVILSLFLLNDLFLRRIDHNSLRVDGYYLEDKDSLDVVMLGASDVYTCFSSGRAYQDYGFTSYPFATQSITASGTITALKEVVRTQSPELIMVEINAFLYGTDNNESIEAHMRKLVDNIPLTKNKIEFISKNVKPDEQPEYYFPLIKYHSIWKEYPYQLKMVSARLRERNRGTSLFKGYRTTATMFRPKDKVLNDKIIDDNKTKALTPSLENKLREMLDYCKSENLNVVFMRNPHLVYKRTYDRVRRCNRAAEIINSYGYDFINLERDWKKIGIDTKTDFYNYDHLNVYGAVKVTEYLSKIIRDKYGVTPREISDKLKEEWRNAATYFNKIYRYSDWLMKNGYSEVKIEEDDVTLDALEKY